jgi:hypothetical protein
VDIGSWTAAAIILTYLLVVVTVALLAAAHPDPRRRADARAVLDRLLKLLPRRRQR